jgi:hypothetical protein
MPPRILWLGAALIAAVTVAYFILNLPSGYVVHLYIGDRPVTADHLYVTVVSVMFHRVNSSRNPWYTCDNSTHNLDLSKLRGNFTLLANCPLPSGTYNLVFISVSSVNAIINGATYACRLPSSIIKVPLEPILVVDGSGRSVYVDMGFLDHVVFTGGGGCIVNPVVRASVGG